MNHTKRRALSAWVATAAAASALGATALTAQAAPAPVSTGQVARPATADPGFAARERAASADVTSTRASRDALAKIQARVARYVATNGTRYSFATYADAKGTVIMESDAPAKVRASLTDLGSDATVTSVRVKTTEVEAITSSVAASRAAPPPLYGGAGLTGGGRVCTSAYPVKTAAGTRFMVIGRSCFAPGTAVYSGASGFVGTVTGVSTNPSAALLQGGSYAGRVRSATGSRPIVAAGSASVGYNNYCHTGRTTGERCGHTATSVNAQLCTASGCVAPVIRFTGGVLPQAGDSGSPFFAKDRAGGAWIRGHVIGGNSTASYAETYNRVAARYGVTVVTG